MGCLALKLDRRQTHPLAALQTRTRDVAAQGCGFLPSHVDRTIPRSAQASLLRHDQLPALTCEGETRSPEATMVVGLMSSLTFASLQKKPSWHNTATRQSHSREFPATNKEIWGPSPGRSHLGLHSYPWSPGAQGKSRPSLGFVYSGEVLILG